MSRYRRTYDRSYRPSVSTSDSSDSSDDDDYDDYGITSREDIPDVVYADQAYLQPAPSKQSYYPTRQVTPQKPLKSILKSISPFGPNREPTPLVSSDSSEEDETDDAGNYRRPTDQTFGAYGGPIRFIPSSPPESDSSSEHSEPLRQVFPRRSSKWDASNIRRSPDSEIHWYSDVQDWILDVWYWISDFSYWIYEVLERLRTVILHVLMEVGAWLWRSVGLSGLITSILFLALLAIFRPSSNMTGDSTNRYRNSLDSLASFSDVGKLYPQVVSKPKFGVGRSVMDIITGGGWPDPEADKREVDLWTVVNLQGRYAETAKGCKEMLDATRAAVAHHPDIVVLWRISKNTEWDSRGLVSKELEKVAKTLGQKTNKQSDDFRQRSRLFYGKVKEEDLKLAHLAGQIKSRVSRPPGEDLDAKRKWSAGSFFSKTKKRTADSTKAEVGKEEKEEDHSLEAAKILHLVSSNLVSTSGWIDAARDDIVAITSTLAGLISALQTASSEAVNRHPRALQFHEERGKQVVWNSMLKKARESGLSDQAAQKLRGLPDLLVTAQDAITDVLAKLIDVVGEMKQLSNDLSVPNTVLAPRWTDEKIIQLYKGMADKMEESIALLRMPPELY